MTTAFARIALTAVAAINLDGALHAAPAATFTSQYIEMFERMWKDAPPLRKAAKGLPRLSPRGLHDAIGKRPYLPADREAERAILQVFSNSGLYPSRSSALRITCRGDICETLFVGMRDADRAAVSRSDANSSARAAVAARKACGPNGYGISMIGGDIIDRTYEKMAFFCISDGERGK